MHAAVAKRTKSQVEKNPQIKKRLDTQLQLEGKRGKEETKNTKKVANV
jgi:hypothetical protein